MRSQVFLFFFLGLIHTLLELWCLVHEKTCRIINQYICDRTETGHLRGRRLLKKKSWVLSFQLGKINAQISAYIFRRDLQKICWTHSQIIFNVNIWISLGNFGSECGHFPDGISPFYHLDAALFTHPTEVFKRTSLTVESSGRDWIPLHILSPSLPFQPL